MPTYTSERKAMFDFSDGYGSDPIRRRYGIDERDIDRSLRQKQLELKLRGDEATIIGQEVSNNRNLAQQYYETKTRAETEAQLADAYQALSNARSVEDYTSIVKRYPNALRDDGFKTALNTGFDTAKQQNEYVVKAAEIGALRQFDQAVGSGMQGSRALAEAATQRQEKALEDSLKVRGMEVPRNEDGSVNQDALSLASAELDSQRLEPEERQFVLDKWRMLSKQVADPQYLWNSDEEKSAAMQQMQDLESLLDPRARRKRQSSTAAPAASGPASVSLDNYFEP